MTLKYVHAIDKYTAQKIDENSVMPYFSRIDDWAMISLNEDEYESAKLNDGWHGKLVLYFEDIASMESLSEEYLKKYPHTKAMSQNDAKLIVDFVEKMKDEVSGIICHCHAGISSSPAVIKWIAEKYNLDNPYKHYTLYNKRVYKLLNDVDNEIKN